MIGVSEHDINQRPARLLTLDVMLDIERRSKRPASLDQLVDEVEVLLCLLKDEVLVL